MSYKFRQYKAGKFAQAYEQIITKAALGIMPEDNILYFMVYAKNYYESKGLKDKRFFDESITIDSYIKEWTFWISLKRQVSKRKLDMAELAYIEKETVKRLKFTSTDEISFWIRKVTLRDVGLFTSYISYLMLTRISSLGRSNSFVGGFG